MAKPILLLLPCTSKKPYSTSPSWKFVLKHVGRYRHLFDIAAVDCITNPQTGDPFGIVHESQESVVLGLDERPDPEKMDALVTEIRRGLTEVAPNYRHIIAYLNVKAYWRAIERVQAEFRITMLPKSYQGIDKWSNSALGAGPIGVFKKSIGELEHEIEARAVQ